MITERLMEIASTLYRAMRPEGKGVSIEDRLSGIVGLGELLKATGTSFETAARIGQEEADWPTYGYFSTYALGFFGFRSVYSGPVWDERVVMRIQAGLVEQPAKAPYFPNLTFWLPSEYGNRYFDRENQRWVE